MPSIRRVYGNWITRLLRGGHRLSDGEYLVLCQLVEQLDSSSRARVEAQFGAYNLVRRDPDGRALHFYHLRQGVFEPPPASLGLPMEQPAATPVRISLEIAGQSEVLDASLLAARGHVVTVSFSYAVPAHIAAGDVVLRRVVKSRLASGVPVASPEERR